MKYLALILTLAFCFGCSKAPAAADAAASESPLQELERGPYLLRVFLTPQEPTLDSALTLTLEYAYPETSRREGSLTLAEGVENFIVDGPRFSANRLLEGGRKLSTAVYTLEPELLTTQEEQYTIPAITLTFAEPDGKRRKLITDAIHPSISQEIPEEALTIDSAAQLGTPLEPPSARRLRRILWGTAALAAAALAAVAAFFMLRRRKRLHEEPVISAYERAMLDLSALQSQQLIAAGEFKRYYSGISNILRNYIEARFELHAPKLTTEEFLAMLTNSPDHLQEFRHLLRQFLTACDLVKFAARTPQGGEAEQLTQTCTSFLDATKPQEEAEPAKA